MRWGSAEWCEAQYADASVAGDDAWMSSERSSQDYRLECLINFISAHISESSNYLDVGCGPGTLMGKLASVISIESGAGVDASQSAVTLAAKNHKNFSFQKRQLPDLNLGGEVFDLISAVEILYYLDQKGRVDSLDAIEKALTPGGYFVFASALDDGTTYFSSASAMQFVANKFEIIAVSYVRSKHWFKIEVPILRLIRFLKRGMPRHHDKAGARFAGLPVAAALSILRRVIRLRWPVRAANSFGGRYFELSSRSNILILARKAS